MAGGRLFLVDTNIVIQLEDDKPVRLEFAEMTRRCHEHGVSLCVHEASERDLKRDPDPKRRAITLSKIAKFHSIRGVSTPPESVLETTFGPITDDNDRVDVLLLNAIERNAADFLITEDLGIHKRARQAGLQDRVFRVKDALDWLIRTFVPQNVILPFIVERMCYQLDKNDQIFDTLRKGYPDFDRWFDQQAARRPCWCLEIAGQIAGIVIRKDNEPRTSTDATLPGNKILKISTFKVKNGFRGEKFGEHLLKQILWYAQRNQYDLVYLTAYAEDQEILADLLAQYGFRATALKGDEQIYEKQMQRGPVAPRSLPLADDLEHYPCFREDGAVQAICVPIQPRWYRVLYPENAPQPSLLDSSADQRAERTPGNTIRKVYLCRTPMKIISPGDVLLFYLSGREIGCGHVRTIGIVEKMAEMRDPEGLLRATGRRSVYSAQEQISILEASRSAVKVVDFILVGHLKDPIPLKLLHKIKAFKGNPQTFTRVEKNAYLELNIHARLGYA